MRRAASADVRDGAHRLADPGARARSNWSSAMSTTATPRTMSWWVPRTLSPSSICRLRMICGKALGSAPKSTLPDVLEQQRDADRGDERGEPRRAAHRAVGEALDDHPEEGADRHGDDEDQERLPERGLGPRAEPAGAEEAEERAQHVDVAVREVDQPQDAVDHRVAQGDQGVDDPQVTPLTSCCRNSATYASPGISVGNPTAGCWRTLLERGAKRRGRENTRFSSSQLSNMPSRVLISAPCYGSIVVT